VLADKRAQRAAVQRVQKVLMTALEAAAKPYEFVVVDTFDIEEENLWKTEVEVTLIVDQRPMIVSIRALSAKELWAAGRHYERERAGLKPPQRPLGALLAFDPTTTP
jgi:hypothetical protein